MMTPHMEVLGAREIPRDEFLDRIESGTGTAAGHCLTE